MSVGGIARFTRAAFEGSVDLSLADFAALNLSGTAFSDALNMRTMSYKQISAAKDELKSHDTL